jgi:hypothetical protein
MGDRVYRGEPMVVAEAGGGAGGAHLTRDKLMGVVTTKIEIEVRVLISWDGNGDELQ